MVVLLLVNSNLLFIKEMDLNRINEELSYAGSKYRAVEMLGSGNQASVVKVVKDNKEYAAKVYKMNSSDIDFVIGENNNGISDIYFSLSMKHANIIETHEFIMSGVYAFLIMDLAMDSLDNYILTNPSPLIKAKIIFDIGTALEYIHDSGLVHCDVKTPNTLVLGPTLFVLSDLGLMRHEEEVIQQACQTYNYRAPEFLDDRQGYDIVSSKRHLWSDNYMAGEIWSYGMFCLEILYSKPFMIYKDMKWNVKYDNTHDRYDIFIDILLARSVKESVYDIILDLFGLPGNGLLDLLKLVCDKLLVLDQDKRIKSYREFLSDRYFTDKVLVRTKLNCNVHKAELPLLRLFERDVDESLEYEKIADYINDTTSWMLDITSAFISPLVIMDSIDFFIQKFYTYVSKYEDIRVFALATIFLMSRLHSMNTGTIDDYLSLVSHKYDAQTINDYVISILSTEKGRPRYESLYSYIPSKELLMKAMAHMLYVENYDRLGGPRGLALYLLKNESEEELKERTVKDYKVLDHYEIIEMSWNL